MNKLLIIGAGGHGRVVADIATCLNKYKEIAFLDDAPKKGLPYPLYGKIANAKNYLDQFEVVIAIGDNLIRERIYNIIKESGGIITSLIHPCSVISSNVKISSGSVIMPGVIINNGASIGEGCIINTAATVDHDCCVEDFSHISVGAHLCGTVKIENHTWIGAGAIIKNNVSICSNCIIGAGAVVIKDIKVRGIYVGVPAKKRLSSG